MKYQYQENFARTVLLMERKAITILLPLHVDVVSDGIRQMQTKIKEFQDELWLQNKIW